MKAPTLAIPNDPSLRISRTFSNLQRAFVSAGGSEEMMLRGEGTVDVKLSLWRLCYDGVCLP